MERKKHLQECKCTTNQTIETTNELIINREVNEYQNRKQTNKYKYLYTKAQA